MSTQGFSKAPDTQPLLSRGDAARAPKCSAVLGSSQAEPGAVLPASASGTGTGRREQSVRVRVSGWRYGVALSREAWGGVWRIFNKLNFSCASLLHPVGEELSLCQEMLHKQIRVVIMKLTPASHYPDLLSRLYLPGERGQHSPPRPALDLSRAGPCSGSRERGTTTQRPGPGPGLAQEPAAPRLKAPDSAPSPGAPRSPVSRHKLHVSTLRRC